MFTLSHIIVLQTQEFCFQFQSRYPAPYRELHGVAKVIFSQKNPAKIDLRKVIFLQTNPAKMDLLKKQTSSAW